MPRSKEGFQWTPTSVTVGLETQAVIPSTPESELKSSYDVIVIGAGYTGLTAARDISLGHGSNVLLVDARDRIGGRTWTASALGENFEMGGTWIHWNQPHFFAQAYRYGLDRFIKTSNGTEKPEKAIYKAATGSPHGIDVQEMDRSMENIGQAFFSPDGLTSRELMPYPHEPFRAPGLWTRYDHLSLKDRMDQLPGFSSHEKEHFEALMTSIGSGPGTDIGFVEPLRWFALGGHTVSGMFEIIETFKLGAGGQTALARNILNDYRGHVKMQMPVKEIDQSSKGVVVTSTTGRAFEAKYAVCTIPLNVLQDIEFNPPFSPLRQEAIQKGHTNKGTKFHFKLDRPEPPWLAMANAYGSSPWVLAFSDHNGTGKNEGSGNYAIGFGYNGHLGRRENSDEIVSSFNQYVRPDVKVASYLTHDWVNDPWSKGAWSTWGPGEMSKYLSELQKDHGRVIMASSDWADGWRGFIDGAIERGTVAGRTVGERLSSTASKL